MFIINAPMLFSGIWAMIKVWLDEKTKNKITILGSSYKEELLKFVIFNTKFRLISIIYLIFWEVHQNVKEQICCIEMWDHGTQMVNSHSFQLNYQHKRNRRMMNRMNKCNWHN